MLGLTELGIAQEFDTEGCEFYVALGKNSDCINMDRLELFNRVRDDV